MRTVIIIVTLLLSVAAGLAADKDSEKKPKTTDVQKKSGQKAVTEKKTPTWPRPYNSSEEISVDTTVPFPTDI